MKNNDIKNRFQFKMRLSAVIPVFAVTIFLIPYFILNSYRLWQNSNWDQSKGRIVYSGNSENTQRDSKGKTQISRSLGEVSFVYTIKGKEFTADKPGQFSRWMIGGYDSLFPADDRKEIPVWVNPENPAEAVLLNGVHSGFYLASGITAYFIIFSLAGIFLLLGSKEAVNTFGGMTLITVSGIIFLPRFLLYSDTSFLLIWILGCLSSLFLVLGVLIIFGKWIPYAKKIAALYMLLVFFGFFGAIIYNNLKN